MKNIQVRNRDILLANVMGRFMRWDDRCGTYERFIIHGKLEGKYVICPFHFAEFGRNNWKKKSRILSIFFEGCKLSFLMRCKNF